MEQEPKQEPTFPRVAVRNVLVWGAGLIFGALPLIISSAFQWIETRNLVFYEYAREVLFVDIMVGGVILMNYFSADFDGRSPQVLHKLSFTQFFFYFVCVYAVVAIVLSACMYGRYSVGGLNEGVQAEIMRVALFLLAPLVLLALMFEVALAWRTTGGNQQTPPSVKPASSVSGAQVVPYPEEGRA